MLHLQSFLEKYYTPDENIILACSTGPDSMFLLHQLLQTSYKKNIVACYFNHKLRIESDQEALFLQNEGIKQGFQVEIGYGNIKTIKENFRLSIGIEELAREKRYAFLRDLCIKYKTKYIITAHHADDKIETFFFHLARGSKLTGLINMTEKGGDILRPLLHLEKSQILTYMDENHLEYTIDKSNFDTTFSRNHLRNTILPEFFSINSQFKKNILHTLEYFEDVKNHIDNEVQVFLDQHDGYFLICDFHHLSLFLQKEIIRYLYYISNNNSTVGLSASNIQEVLRFISGKNNKTRKEIQGLHMKKDGVKIFFSGI